MAAIAGTYKNRDTSRASPLPVYQPSQCCILPPPTQTRPPLGPHWVHSTVAMPPASSAKSAETTRSLVYRDCGMSTPPSPFQPAPPSRPRRSLVTAKHSSGSRALCRVAVYHHRRVPDIVLSSIARCRIPRLSRPSLARITASPVAGTQRTMVRQCAPRRSHQRRPTQSAPARALSARLRAYKPPRECRLGLGYTTLPSVFGQSADIDDEHTSSLTIDVHRASLSPEIVLLTPPESRRLAGASRSSHDVIELSSDESEGEPPMSTEESSNERTQAGSEPATRTEAQETLANFPGRSDAPATSGHRVYADGAGRQFTDHTVSSPSQEGQAVPPLPLPLPLPRFDRSPLAFLTRDDGTASSAMAARQPGRDPQDVLRALHQLQRPPDGRRRWRAGVGDGVSDVLSRAGLQDRTKPHAGCLWMARPEGTPLAGRARSAVVRVFRTGSLRPSLLGGKGSVASAAGIYYGLFLATWSSGWCRARDVLLYRMLLLMRLHEWERDGPVRSRAD
ncbi:hypothetical protein BC628DRAFT_1196683 [Trametes gibbosa]|nr:hypothetical protein BC628DRAFT_1196683 [Trametes gibbosa]